MEDPPLHTLNLTGVESESKRIINNNYNHFLFLSLLFLPLSFFLINPTLRLSDHLFTADHRHQTDLTSHLPYILISYIISLSAIATITYNTYHGFLGTKVNFFTAMKTLTSSFFPIVSTAALSHLLIALISLTFHLFVKVILTLGQTLGFVLDHNSTFFKWFSTVTLFVIIIYFHVNWSLALVIVVTESKWGFAPLMRSSYLTKGMRSVCLWLLLYFGTFGVNLVWFFSDNLHLLSFWQIVLCRILGSSFLVMLLLQITAANTVLYMYCKALHGELAIDVADEFVQYIKQPSDDVKVPRVVNLVTD